MGDIQCEKCGWIGDEGLYSHAHPKGSADLICPACQQVVDGLEVDWKERYAHAENDLADVRHDLAAAVDRVIAANKRAEAAEAELATVKAALPRWKAESWSKWVLQTQRQQIAAVDLVAGKWSNWLDGKLTPYDTREAAMTAVTEALGLPPCEVEGE